MTDSVETDPVQSDPGQSDSGQSHSGQSDSRQPDPAAMVAVVERYVAAFDAGSADAAAALYAVDAIVEDPVGADPVRGRDAIRAFYAASMATGARLSLQGPVRIASPYAVFPFSVILEHEGQTRRIDVIDTFRFNAENEVTEMRAFWGPTNMHGF
jgi:steroid delta-isomerase